MQKKGIILLLFGLIIITSANAELVKHPLNDSYPTPLFNVSYGCPVVANATLRKIDKLIKSGEKDMLLWIYD